MQKKDVSHKKILEEQQAIGAIYKQYIDTFQETSEIPRKTFVKSATLYADKEKPLESEKNHQRQLYNPKPIVKSRREAQQETSRASSKRTKFENKKKSNLKSLGDELKLLQHERGKKEVRLEPPSSSLSVSSPSGIYDNEYTHSTNLFVSNLSQSVSESKLIEIFGEFGALASVKIMWPRKQEVARNVNCGFVAFMSRSDAERALNGLKKREDMRINWGKSVKLPPFPVHVPEKLSRLYAPPPRSGLPFSAQKTANGCETVVRVTIPFNRNELMLIHRMVEFVVREGPEFEALVASIEEENSEYGFLREFESPSHTYYRWRLFSILNGETKSSWRPEPFRMYVGGSVWVPPVAVDYASGMPRELIAADESGASGLSQEERVELVCLIRNLTIARESISEAMFFCLSRSARAISDVLGILLDSFRNAATSPLKKLARLYLLSDVLVNLMRKRNERIEARGWVFEVFNDFHGVYSSLKFCEDKECLKKRMLKVIRAWVALKVFDTKIVNKLEMVFLFGIESQEEEEEEEEGGFEPLDGRCLLRSFAGSTSDCLIVKNARNFDIFSPRSVLFKN